jgi:CheY-like chemotaxis protein
MQEPSLPRKVLLVEDSDDDVFFFMRAARERPSVSVVRVAHGEEAKAYLRGEGPFEDRAVNPLPDAIVSDLKMPYCSGTELTKWVRAQPGLASINVTVVSSSNVHLDLQAALDAGADAYLVKPSSLPGYKHFWESLEKLWAHGAASPSRNVG